jgi:hypothetical protein
MIFDKIEKCTIRFLKNDLKEILFGKMRKKSNSSRKNEV